MIWGDRERALLPSLPPVSPNATPSSVCRWSEMFLYVSDFLSFTNEVSKLNTFSGILLLSSEGVKHSCSAVSNDLVGGGGGGGGGGDGSVAVMVVPEVPPIDRVPVHLYRYRLGRFAIVTGPLQYALAHQPKCTLAQHVVQLDVLHLDLQLVVDRGNQVGRERVAGGKQILHLLGRRLKLCARIDRCLLLQFLYKGLYE
uniref:Uncharacterized protein n=1 Tax=Anopheles melas TaxID=34690 RepID=A0A182U079_9DIPT